MMKEFSEAVLGGFFSYFKQHPALILSTAYFLWAITGVIYLYLFYSEFNIPIFHFLEIADVLLAGLQEPKISVAFFLGLSLCGFILWLAEKGHELKKKVDLTKRWKRVLFNLLFYTPKNLTTIRWGLLIVLCVYFHTFLQFFINERLKSLVSTEGDWFSIQHNGEVLIPDCDDSSSEKWRLLGTSTKFIFVYSPACYEMKVLSVESVESINLIQRVELKVEAMETNHIDKNNNSNNKDTDSKD